MEETISLKEIFETIKKRLLLIVLLVFGAAAISAIISFFVLTPTYQASTQFIVSQSNEQTNMVDLNQIRTNVELISTYNEIIKSPRVLNRVSDELGVDVTSNAINVTNAQSSQVVKVTVTDTDPDMAVAIANTTFTVFQDEVPNLMNVNNVSILSEAVASANPQPVAPNPMLNIAIAMVVGAMAGVGLAFLLEYLDNTIKTEQDIENKLELPVIGVISHIGEDDIVTTQFNKAMSQRGRGEIGGQAKKTS
ncbi:Wzz/FepE/Etk N-terminal domain-containing protein [Aquibacillus koreensis]|uniref:Wzz/FepE/Etk N-terminal domain-containing protein n=1 Tax=Aquibacillus koreensis TaxID=279446 RepID=A0A9X3WHF4_9BACI|nr:Wzz/FepE/Etk N-terminal domain-containing protein [Aquibacillus koreensis]MCT2534623.1 Wzz/FepE/Etk N-terminal domain-containing protein [Aquibacillus koreensis]MDC3419807.1 Wzz/FepE/Etk N-terminal domain-containing protein [Aquibacillus koreensis]